jgi:uncharacterized protein (TIGR02145 family)
MKRRKQFIHLLLIVGLFFAANTACDKNDDSFEGILKDADGNVYKTVKIGSQVWMSENLKTTKYNDGTAIPNITNRITWENLNTGAYCNYDDIEENANEYGRLYNWFAVETGKLAPQGWHVPTTNEWEILVDYLTKNRYNYDKTKSQDKTAKSLASNSGWKLSYEEGDIGTSPENNNRTGFTGLPSGLRDFEGMYRDMERTGIWWSSSESGNYNAVSGGLHYDSHGLFIGDNTKQCGMSIRCLKD